MKKTAIFFTIFVVFGDLGVLFIVEPPDKGPKQRERRVGADQVAIAHDGRAFLALEVAVALELGDRCGLAIVIVSPRAITQVKVGAGVVTESQLLEVGCEVARERRPAVIIARAVHPFPLELVLVVAELLLNVNIPCPKFIIFFTLCLM